MNKHAYLIIAHNEPLVLQKLLTLLDDERNDIYLHIDQRANEMYERFRYFKLVKSRLCILSDRIPVYWGDISQLDVEYKLFETAFHSGYYSYFHLLSGVDLPIKSQDYIHKFFVENEGKEFVGYWNSEGHLKDLNRKVYRYYFFTKYFKGGSPLVHGLTAFTRNVILAIQKITNFRRNQHLQFKKGFQWVSITGNFCKYLIEHKESVMKTFRYTLCPDEIFIQTVLWNSPYRDQVFSLESAVEGSMRAIDWERGHPYVWTLEDWPELQNSKCLFARKFSSSSLP